MSKVRVEDDASMEDVLASIRRIISDDIEREEGHKSIEEVSKIASVPKESHDVLDLTDVVTSNGTIIRLKPKQVPKMKTDHRPVKAPPQSSQDAIFSADTVQKSLAALKDLSQLQDKALETVRDGSFGQQTMEEFVVSMMKPMLKTWMDANLPSLVKWVVAEQIEKLMKEQQEELVE